jgi:hypothetical protein
VHLKPDRVSLLSPLGSPGARTKSPGPQGLSVTPSQETENLRGLGNYLTGVPVHTPRLCYPGELWRLAEPEKQDAPKTWVGHIVLPVFLAQTSESKDELASQKKTGLLD